MTFANAIADVPTARKCEPGRATAHRLGILAVFAMAFIPVAARGDEPKPAPAKYPFTVAVQGKGPPMLLIPGLACSGEVWNDAVKRFGTAFECHVLTLAGFAGVPAQDGPFLDTVRDGIVKYVRDMKLDRPVVVGHSIGGFLAYEVGIAAPSAVGPLVAVDGLPFLPALSNEAATEEQMKTAFAGMAKRFADLPRADYLKQQEATLAVWIDDEAKRAKPVKWGAASDQATVGKAVAEMFSRDLRDKVAGIKAPVLLVAAPVAFGDITKEEARKRYAAQVDKIPNKTVAVAEKSKHFVMFDEPEWLWQQIEAFVAKSRKQ